MSANPARERYLIVAAIVVGSLAATAVFRSRLAGASDADANSQKLGFKSATEKRKADQAFEKYRPEVLGTGRVTDEQFSLFQASLRDGSFPVKVQVIATLAYVTNDSDRRRLASLIPSRKEDEKVHAFWKHNIGKWMAQPNDSKILNLLRSGVGQGAAEVADELQKGNTQ